jgi:hypothetical protein
VGAGMRRSLPWASVRPATSSSTMRRMVEVDKDVSLEVLDWGGAGRPLVLTGLADDAHIFDQFAPKITATDMRRSR